MHIFKLHFWHVRGCGGYPLSSKSILKVVSQMVRLCDYATVLSSYLHIDFLTFLALLKNTFRDGTPCTFMTIFVFPQCNLLLKCNLQLLHKIAKHLSEMKLILNFGFANINITYLLTNLLNYLKKTKLHLDPDSELVSRQKVDRN